MGSTQAAGFAELVGEGLANLDISLNWHLRSNHFPPIPLSMKPVAKEAIKKAYAGEWDAEIETPFPHSSYGHHVPVHEIVQSLHLEEFITKEIAEILANE